MTRMTRPAIGWAAIALLAANPRSGAAQETTETAAFLRTVAASLPRPGEPISVDVASLNAALRAGGFEPVPADSVSIALGRTVFDVPTAEAVIAHSPALFATVGDRLHVEFLSLERTDSTVVLHIMHRWAMPAGENAHIVFSIVRTELRRELAGWTVTSRRPVGPVAQASGAESTRLNGAPPLDGSHVA